MIICICKAVNDRAIRRAVAEGHDTFDELQFELGIGTCCGKCVAAACEVLCEARAEALEATQVARPVQYGQRQVRHTPSREVALA